MTSWMRPVGVASMLALATTLVAAELPSATASAQPVEVDDADWVPFEGTWPLGCTRANPENPGCEVHHPTWAVDFAAPTGIKVRATGGGMVVSLTRSCAPLGGDGECNGGAGNLVIVDHGDYWSRYLHLSTIPRRIRVGSRVEVGTTVGRSGASGTFGGAHLHYDEYQPTAPTGRVAFGRMFACHGDEAVLYPDVLGYDAWDEVPPGTPIRNDGFDCTGHPRQPHPPAPEPPIYPKGPPLGIGGSPSVAVADYDGDGRRDLAIGVPGADVGSAGTAGAVVVIDPLDRSRSRLLVQAAGLGGTLERGDRAGAAIATGDFDCDGNADLAVGSPGEDLATPFVDTGAVSVVFATGVQQGLFAGLGLDAYYSRPSDWVGAALAAGDFDADGCDDLAIASPGADRSGGQDMGLVWVLSGSAAGLTAPVKLLQGIGLGGILETGDQTGYTMAVGDFDCDGVADLAIGAPREAITATGDGAVLIGYGSTTGIRGTDVLYQGNGLAGSPTQGEWAGSSLAAGDIDGDGCDDLAVGVPGERAAGRTEAGGVLVTFGHIDGLAASGRQYALRAGAGLPSRARAGDRVGTAVAIVDLDGNGRSDLIVGAPGVDRGRRRDCGAVLVREGSRIGFGSGTRYLRQGRGLPGRPGADARIGTALVGALIDPDRFGDLVISAPGTTVRGQAAAGAVHVVFGSRSGTSPRPAFRVDQRAELPGRPTEGATFGGAAPVDLLRRALRGS